MEMEWTHWINHELKAPLNRIESLLLSLNKSSNVGYDEKKLISMMQDSLTECRSTLDSLYLYNKITKKEIEPIFYQQDLNQLISQAVQDSKISADEKKISFVMEMEPLFLIPIDEQLFKRAFLNILENAVKFSPEKSKILISTETIKNEVVIQISDQGVGMSESEMGKIFEPYYRAESTSFNPGSGLGLYIAKTFIEYQKGRIEVESVEGSGTTFTLYILNGGELN